MTYHAKVIAGGKIVIPADLRRELGIRDGDSVVLESRDGGLSIRTYEQTVRDVQAKVKAMLSEHYDGRIVDELIADRRAEAARENAEHEERQLRAVHR